MLNRGDTIPEADAESGEAPIDTFGIVLPEEWVRIPLDGHDFEEFVRGQRRRLSKDTELSPTAVRQFELMMRQMRNDCQREHVSLAASLLATIEEPDTLDDGEAIEPGLLTAACMITTIDRHEMGAEVPLTPNTIAAAMGREPQPGDDGVVVSNLERPELVELPAGRAVKLVRLHTHPPSAATGERLAVFGQHFLVPFGGGQRAAVVTFSSLTLQYARPLSKLFDSMIETFRMFSGDDSTDPTADPRLPDESSPPSQSGSAAQDGNEPPR